MYFRKWPMTNMVLVLWYKLINFGLLLLVYYYYFYYYYYMKQTP